MTMSDDIIIACPSCKKQMDVRVGQKRVQCPYCGAIFRKKSRLEKGMDAWLERRGEGGKKRRKEKEVAQWREELDRQEAEQLRYSRVGSEETGGQSKKKTTPCAWVALAVFLSFMILVIIGTCLPIKDPGIGVDPAARAEGVQRARNSRAEVEPVVERALRLNIIWKIDPRLSQVWVMPLFFQLPFDSKKELISVVLVYVRGAPGCQDANYLTLIDGMTGKKVGQYDWQGFRLE